MPRLRPSLRPRQRRSRPRQRRGRPRHRRRPSPHRRPSLRPPPSLSPCPGSPRSQLRRNQPQRLAPRPRCPARARRVRHLVPLPLRRRPRRLRPHRFPGRVQRPRVRAPASPARVHPARPGAPRPPVRCRASRERRVPGITRSRPLRAWVSSSVAPALRVGPRRARHALERPRVGTPGCRVPEAALVCPGCRVRIRP